MSKNLGIIHINLYDGPGGAAKVAMRLVEAQRRMGHQSLLLVSRKESPFPYSLVFDSQPDPALQANCISNGQLSYEFQGSHQLDMLPVVRSADVLHLHNLHHDYFNPFSLAGLSKLKPVIWTLHDMQSFTGHCAHSYACDRWKTGCGECPDLTIFPALPVDATAQLWRDKRNIYQHSDFKIVTPSHWLRMKVEESMLGRDKVEVVCNGTDIDVFRPYDRSEMRRAFHLPENALLIGCVAHGGVIKNRWKGGEYMLAAMRALRERLTDAFFLNIGADDRSEHDGVVNIRHVGDESTLAQLLSALDIFLFTSLAENCPLSVMEALACGVPVVAFDTGGVPELVRDRVDGLVVEYRNTGDLQQALLELARHPGKRQTMRANARAGAVARFDQNVLAGQYEAIYRQQMAAFSNTTKRRSLIPLDQVPALVKTPSFLELMNRASGGARGVRSEKENNTVEPDVKAMAAAKGDGLSKGDSPNTPDRSTRKQPAQRATCHDRHTCHRITIVTPSFNQGEYLEACIESVVAQGYPNLEYIVMDGGSTDRSVEIIKKYEKYISYWQSKPDGGQYAAINEAFARSCGTIMGWLNSDDKLHWSSLYILDSLFACYPDVEWVMGRYCSWNTDGSLGGVNPIIPEWTRERYLQRAYGADFFIQQESTFWRRSLWERAGGGLQTRLKLAADFELWSRFFKYAPLHRLDALLGGFRSHAGQKTRLFMQDYEQEVDVILREERAKRPNEGEVISKDAPPVISLNHLVKAGGDTVRKDNFDLFTYSKRWHFACFAREFANYPGRKPDINNCDLKLYQDLLVYNFVRANVPQGSRILEVGGGEARVLQKLAVDYECWNVDKLEGLGSGPRAVNLPGIRLVEDYMGAFNRELPGQYFDLVFSISALEHVPEREETFRAVVKDIGRVLKHGGFSLHCFDVAVQEHGVWSNGLVRYIFDRVRTVNHFVPFLQLAEDPHTYSMSKVAYDRLWRCVTGVEYQVFGKPCSYNVLWQAHAADDAVSVSDPPPVTVKDSRNEIEQVCLSVRSLRDNRQFEKAENVIRRALEHHPEEPDLLVLQADIQMELGGWEKARTLLEGIIARWPLRADARSLMARVLMRGNDYKRAIQHARKSAEMDVTNIIARLILGQALMKLGRKEEALRSFEAALTLDANRVDALKGAARCCLDAAQVERASNYVTQALALQPEDGELHELKKAIQIREATPDDARVEMSQGDYLVSAIVSVYNCERFLAGCVDDLESQTIAARLQIVIVNTGSLQNEDAIVRECQRRYSNITYIKTERRETIYAAWNRGVKASRGRYLTNANADDRHRRDALECMAGELERREVGMVYGDTLITKQPNQTFEENTAHLAWKQPDFHPLQMLMFCPFGPQPMWRRSVHDTVGRFDSKLTIAGDYELFLHIAWKFGAYHIRQLLGLYYENQDSLSYANQLTVPREVRSFLSRYRLSVALDQLYKLPLQGGRTDRQLKSRALCDYATRLMLDFPEEYANHHETEVLFRRALKEDPLEMAAINNLALLLAWKQKRKAEAIGMLAGIMHAFPSAQANWSLLRVVDNVDAALAAKLEIARVVWNEDGIVPEMMGIHESRVSIGSYERSMSPGVAREGEVDSAMAQAPLGYGGKTPLGRRKRPVVSIILSVFNQAAATQRCLRAIENSAGSLGYETIIIDDASDNETAAFFKNNRRYRYHRNENPAGFACACNQGAMMARGEHLAFLSPETEPQPGWLEAAIKVFEQNPKVGAVGCKLIHPDHTIQHCGYALQADADPVIGYAPVPRYRGVPADDPRVNRREEVVAVSSAAMIVPRNVFVRFEGFNLQYSMGYEDIDCCHKLFSNGYTVVYEPDAVVIYREDDSSRDRKATEQRQDQSRRLYYLSWRTQMPVNPPATRNPECGVDVYWTAAFLSHTGYSFAMRSHVLALNHLKVRIKVGLMLNSPVFIGDLTEAEFLLWKSLYERPINRDVLVSGTVAATKTGKDIFEAVRREDPDFLYYVGYTMFESDRIPESWVKACNAMDEVWVPSRFNQETFARSGVKMEKLAVVPIGMDLGPYQPEKVVPLEIEGRRTYAFLAMFEWSHRKGWEILLRAYLDAFSKNDDVCLLLHTYVYERKKPSERLEEFLEGLGRKREDCPAIVITDRVVKEAEVPALFKAANAYVLPSRGEGWGLPYMQAMAMGLPTIGTRWSANLDFMNDANSYLIDCEVVPIPDRCLGEQPLYRELYGGHCWAEPSVEHTARLMRHVYEHREEAKRKGQIARRHIAENFSGERVAQTIIQNLKRIGESELFRSRKKRG